MWEIKNPTIQKAKLNFTSSEQGFCGISQLVSDGVVLMNALELMEFDEDRIQVLICDHCGIVHCKSGDWINLRLAGDFVIMIPAFDEMQDDWSKTEYNPPRYFKKEGTPYFSLETYKNLQNQSFTFPQIESIKVLQMREAVRLAQFYMPMKLFGEPPEVNLNHKKTKNIIASSKGEVKEWIKKIESYLRQNYENKSFVNLRYPKSEEEIIYLFVDIFEFTDWKVLVENDSGTKLVVEETFVIETLEN